MSRVRLSTAFAAIVLAMSPLAAAAPAAQQQTLDLDDGYRFQMIGAGETEARVGNPKTIYINVALTDPKLLADKKRVIEAADRMFESVLLGAAEKGYYSRAIVNIRRPTAAAAYDDFLYVRGANEVWLRQAGAEPWKTAQDPKAWQLPQTEKLEFKDLGTFNVEVALEIPAPEGFSRAAEIDFVTKTPLTDIQRKYKEIKALWARIDREKMRADGFDLVMFGNFAEAQRGRFHARKGFFVRIPRDANGDWPELPDRAPDDRELLLSKNETPAAGLSNAIAASFTTGPAGVKLADFIALPFGPPAPSVPSVATVGFAEGAPAINFDPAKLLDLQSIAITIR